MRPLLFLVKITLVEAPNDNLSVMMKGPIYLGASLPFTPNCYTPLGRRYMKMD